MVEGQLKSLNLRNAMLYDFSSGGKVERVLLHPFSSHFLKENLFWGVPALAFLVFLVPKLYLDVKKMCKKFCEIPTIGLDLDFGPTLTTPLRIWTWIALWCNGATRIYSIVETTWTS